MNPLKAIKSLFSGLLATVSLRHFADAGVKVGIAPDPLEEAEKALSFVIQRENETHAKLVAAADALREIKIIACRSDYLDYEGTCKVYNMALDAHNAATQV